MKGQRMKHSTVQRQLLFLVCLVLVAGPTRGQDSTEGKFLFNIRQVTSGFVKAGEGYFSPDGKQIVYQAQPLDYPFYQIYTQPLNVGRSGPERPAPTKDSKSSAVLPAEVAARPKRISTFRVRKVCSYFSPDGQR